MAKVLDEKKLKEERKRINNIIHVHKSKDSLHTTLLQLIKEKIFNVSIVVTRKLLNDVYVLDKKYLERDFEKSKMDDDKKQVEFIPSVQQRYKISRILKWIFGRGSYPFSSTWSEKMAGGFLIGCLTDSDSGQIVKINLKKYLINLLASVWEGDSKSQISNFFIRMKHTNPEEGVLRILDEKGKETKWVSELTENPEVFVNPDPLIECIKFWKEQQKSSTTPSCYLHFSFIQEHYPELANRFLNQPIPIICNNYTAAQELKAYVKEASVAAKHEIPQLHMSMVNTSYGADISDHHLKQNVFKDTVFMNTEYPNSYPWSEIVHQIHQTKKKGYTQKEDSFLHTIFSLVLNKPDDNQFDLSLLKSSPFNSILCTPFNDEALDRGQSLSILYNELIQEKKDLFIDSFEFISECYGNLFNDEFINNKIKLKNWYETEHTSLRNFVENLSKEGKIEVPDKFSFDYTNSQFKKFQYTHSDFHILNWIIVCSLGFLFNNKTDKNLGAIKIQEIFETMLNEFKSNWFVYLSNKDNVKFYTSTTQYKKFLEDFKRPPSSIIEMLLNTTWDLNVLSTAIGNFIQTEVLVEVHKLYVDNVANSKLRNSFETVLNKPNSTIKVFDFEMYNAYGEVMKWKGGIDMGHPLNKVLGGDMKKSEVIFEDSKLNQNPSKERDIVKDAKKYEYILYKVHDKKLKDTIKSIPNYNDIISLPDAMLTPEDLLNKERVQIETFRFNCFVAYITWKYDDSNKVQEIKKWGELECGDCNNSWDYLIDPPQEYIDTLESFI